MDSIYGARPLRRAIQTMIEDKIAEEIIDGKIKNGDNATVSTENNNIVVIKNQ